MQAWCNSYLIHIIYYSHKKKSLMNLDLDYNTLINSYIYISVGIIQETQRISTFAYMHSRISERISRM
jgi:hypothetical protein